MKRDIKNRLFSLAMALLILGEIIVPQVGYSADIIGNQGENSNFGSEFVDNIHGDLKEDQAEDQEFQNSKSDQGINSHETDRTKNQDKESTEKDTPSSDIEEDLDLDMEKKDQDQWSATGPRQGKSIGILLQDQEGQAISKSSLSLYDSSGQLVQQVQTDPKGQAIFNGLRPGTYMLERLDGQGQGDSNQWTIIISEDRPPVYKKSSAYKEGTSLDGHIKQGQADLVKVQPEGQTYLHFSLSLARPGQKGDYLSLTVDPDLSLQGALPIFQDSKALGHASYQGPKDLVYYLDQDIQEGQDLDIYLVLEPLDVDLDKENYKHSLGGEDISTSLEPIAKEDSSLDLDSKTIELSQADLAIYLIDPGLGPDQEKEVISQEERQESSAQDSQEPAKTQEDTKDQAKEEDKANGQDQTTSLDSESLDEPDQVDSEEELDHADTSLIRDLAIERMAPLAMVDSQAQALRLDSLGTRSLTDQFVRASSGLDIGPVMNFQARAVRTGTEQNLEATGDNINNKIAVKEISLEAARDGNRIKIAPNSIDDTVSLITKLDLANDIKPGDYFTILYPDILSPEDIVRPNLVNVMDKRGNLIAEAQYGESPNTLRYVFAEDIKYYKDASISINQPFNVNPDKVTSNETQDVGNKTFNVAGIVQEDSYQIDASNTNDRGRGLISYANMHTAIGQVDRENGKFIQYFHINPTESWGVRNWDLKIEKASANIDLSQSTYEIYHTSVNNSNDATIFNLGNLTHVEGPHDLKQVNDGSLMVRLDNRPFRGNDSNYFDRYVVKITSNFIDNGQPLSADAEIDAENFAGTRRATKHTNYSSNEKGSASISGTETFKPMTFTIKKEDDLGNPLVGSAFRLRGVDQDGQEVYDREIDGSDSATFEFKNLEFGAYTIEETKTPQGFLDPPSIWENMGI